MNDRTPKILLVSTVPSTLWAFYRRMPEIARTRGMELAIASSPDRELDDFATQFGVQTHPLILTRRVSPLRDLRSIRQLTAILREHRYDLVHAFTSKAGLVAMTSAARAQTPCRIYSFLGLPLETATGLTRRLLLLSERSAARKAHTVLACSHSLKNQLEQLRICPPEKLKVLGDGTCCGVNTRRFSRTMELTTEAAALREKLQLPDDAVVIGYVGRLVRDKGIHTTVDAFCKLCDRFPQAHVLLVGDYEPHRGEVPADTRLKIESHPRILHIPFDWNVLPYYALMDVLVLASLREGFPYALLEAACMEIPVVATRATGCVDAVVDGETGYLVQIENVDQLASALAKLLSDPSLRRQMGQAARQRVVSLFTDDRMLDEHFNLYESMLAARR